MRSAHVQRGFPYPASSTNANTMTTLERRVVRKIDTRLLRISPLLLCAVHADDGGRRSCSDLRGAILHLVHRPDQHRHVPVARLQGIPLIDGFPGNAKLAGLEHDLKLRPSEYK